MPNYDKNQSFVNLTTIYLRIDKNSSGLATTVEATLRAAPLSFVRSGYYHYNTSTLRGRGSDGYFWSSRSNSATYAYILNFYSTYIYPQDYFSKGYGFPLRCVAR